jgi:phosphoglycerol transferase MdoB-like AlkP superfamily enzyme
MLAAQQPVLLVLTVAGRNRPALPHARDGWLSHLLTTDPWLGVIVIIAIVLAGLMLALIKTTGRILEGAPWYVRLALLASAGLGISWLLGRNRRAASGPQDARYP